MLLKVDKAKASGLAAVIPHHLHTQRLPWEGPTWLKGELGTPQGVPLSSRHVSRKPQEGLSSAWLGSRRECEPELGNTLTKLGEELLQPLLVYVRL